MIKSNLHRVGKAPYQCYLTPEQKAKVDKVRKLTGSTSSRELLLTLCEHYLAKP